MEGADDDVSRVIHDRAEQALKEAQPAKVMPLELTWGGRYLYIPLAVLVLSMFIPELDLLQRQAVAKAAEEEKELTKEAAVKLTAKMTALKESRTSTESIEGKKITDDFNLLAESLQGASKKEALTKLGEFENKYKKEFTEQREFADLAKAIDIKPDMSGLSEESQEAIKELVDALKDGNMQDAADALRDLAQQMADQSTSQQEKEALAREMQKAMNQLKSEQGDTPGDQLAQTVEQMMQQAQNQQNNGQQSNPNGQNGGQQSSQSMQELAQQAAGQMQQMADMMQQMADSQAMQEGMSQAKQQMIGEQFNNFDSQSVEQMMEAEAQAQLGQSQCPGGGCNQPGCDGGAGCQGNGMMPGNGTGSTGGQGQGRGGAPPEAPDQTAFTDEQSKSKVSEGRILQQVFVKGVPEKGEALVAYGELTKAAKSEAAGALAKDQVPREYEEMVKQYFDSIEPEDR